MYKVVCFSRIIKFVSWGVAVSSAMSPLVSQGQSVSEYRYDALGRLVGVADGVGSSSTYEFDAGSNRVNVRSALQFSQSWAATSPQIGHIVGREEAGGWSARVEDAAGHMIFGPYAYGASAGAHVAAFRMLVDNNDANNSAVVDLDVWDATSGSQLAYRRVTRMEWKAAGAFQVYELPFTVDPNAMNHALEFRIYYLRSSYVRVARVGYR